MIKVCGFRVSNYHNKVLIALLEKGVPYEEDCTVTPSQADEYLARSPHWAHLMRLTLKLGWHDVNRALGKL